MYPNIIVISLCETILAAFQKSGCGKHCASLRNNQEQSKFKRQALLTGEKLSNICCCQFIGLDLLMDDEVPAVKCLMVTMNALQ